MSGARSPNARVGARYPSGPMTRRRTPAGREASCAMRSVSKTVATHRLPTARALISFALSVGSEASAAITKSAGSAAASSARSAGSPGLNHTTVTTRSVAALAGGVLGICWWVSCETARRAGSLGLCGGFRAPFQARASGRRKWGHRWGDRGRRLSLPSSCWLRARSWPAAAPPGRRPRAQPMWP